MRGVAAGEVAPQKVAAREREQSACGCKIIEREVNVATREIVARGLPAYGIALSEIARAG